MFRRTLIASALILSIAAPVRAEQSVGDTLKKIFSTPTPTPSRKKKKTTTKNEAPTPPPEHAPSSPPEPVHKKNGAPNATLAPEAIKGFEENPPRVRTLLSSALELTSRNLDYKYGSADPSAGGMDCSGFVYYVLKQN